MIRDDRGFRRGESEAMRKDLYVALAGNIGAGKTTAARLIAEAFGLRQFEEPAVANRFIGQYYRDMSRWSFTVQMEFLLKRIDHVEEIAQMGAPCVQDRTLIEDPEIFAKYLHGLGHMSDDELELYFDYFKRFNSTLRQPDKIILLHTPDVTVLLRRIALRGRIEERAITQGFLKGLNGYYESFAEVARAKYGLDVLTVDVTRLDFRRGEAKRRFLDEIGAFLGDERRPAGGHTAGGQLSLVTG